MSQSSADRSMPCHLRWADVAVEQMNPHLTRQFLTGAQAMLARIELKKGAVVPLHSHSNEQIAWITEGALRFKVGQPGAEMEFTVRAGEVLVIPADVPHGAEALEDTIDFDIFAPPREDWMRNEDAYLRTDAAPR